MMRKGNFILGFGVILICLYKLCYSMPTRTNIAVDEHDNNGIYHLQSEGEIFLRYA